jgi:acetyl esterase/lipase
VFELLALLLAQVGQDGLSLRARGAAPERASAAAQAPRDSTPFARTLVDSARDNQRALALESDFEVDPGRITVRALDPQGGGALGGGVPALPVLFEVSIPVGGVNELFLFQSTNAAGPRPLLVVFHKFGVSHYDAAAHTTFFQEAKRRGWYCLAPLGGSQRHFSSIKSQIHTLAALDWAAENFGIDATRLYAVGFSMGGGAALNFAARHLDPRGPMFAAVFNESGIVSHEHTYAQTEPIVTAIYDQLFGAGAGALPFPMQRSSLFSFDELTLDVDTATDLARNLLHLSTFTTRTTLDVPYLSVQNDLFHQHLLDRGADLQRHRYAQLDYSGHSWDAVPEKAICDWLRGFTLTLPSAAKTLADRDARYFHFDVEQEVGGAFTPFEWSVDVPQARVSVLETANLRAAGVDLASAGLLSATQLEVVVGTADGQPDQIRLVGWPSAPVTVLRDAMPASSWTFDPLTPQLILTELDGAAHIWTVVR